MPITSPTRESAPTAVVIGASLAGLFAAAALADAGYQVTVVERDRLPDESTPRKGVPQGGQAHVMLQRGWQCADALLPGLKADVIAAGGVRFLSSQMPYLIYSGWLPINRLGVEFVTMTRPLLELCARRRLQQHPAVRIRTGQSVSALSPLGGRWWVRTPKDEEPLVADVVVDASGRTSRLATWLGELGYAIPEPETVDARLGYATRLYRPRRPLPLRTGVVIGASFEVPRGALLFPVEDGHWLISAGGFGADRPPRDAAAFSHYLTTLRDPVLADVEALLEPVSDVAVHRQTKNRRFRFEAVPDWPPGLLAVGDAAAAFNPVYGQGITVAAQQAHELRSRLRSGWAVTRRLQRRLSEVADLPWNIATSADRRMLTSDKPSPTERVLGAWNEQLLRAAVAGDVAASVVFGQLFHLTGPGSVLFNPLLVPGILRSLADPRSAPRPAVLDAIPPRHPSAQHSRPAA